MQQRVGQGADLRRHGRGEQQVLALGRQRGDDPLHVGHEALVEHAVGLVEHEDLDAAQIDLAATVQIEQPSRRGDEDVDALGQLAQLRCLGDAAEDHRVPQIEVLAVGLEAGADLGRELARGREHQRAQHRVVAGARVDALQDRQGERGGLAGAGLGAADDVAAREHGADGLLLDRRGLAVACLLHGAEDRGLEAQLVEGHGGGLYSPGCARARADAAWTARSRREPGRGPCSDHVAPRCGPTRRRPRTAPPVVPHALRFPAPAATTLWA
ncbi:MAG: hypothetical protein U0168_31445 [Nannocystaceae bacterium]